MKPHFRNQLSKSNSISFLFASDVSEEIEQIALDLDWFILSWEKIKTKCY